MKKRLLCVICAIIIIFTMVSCSSSEVKNPDSKSLDNPEIATDDPVVITGWGGDMTTNDWVENTLIPFIKKNEGVDAIWVPADINDILVKLENEKNAGVKSEVDIIWINGENFKYAADNQLLSGPFLEDLPNAKYLNLDDPSNILDFGVPTNGYESPWGRAQFVFIADSTKVESLPTSAVQLKDYLQDNPGKFTYPVATDFTGSAFVRTLLYDIVGYEYLSNLPADYEQVKAAIMPAMDYLNEIKPLLWSSGESYPATLAELDKLYQDEVIDFTMEYSSNASYNQIALGVWSEGSKTFLWDSGTPANTNFLAISAGTARYEQAKKVINAAISPEMQASQSRLDGRASTPVLDMSKLTQEELQLFEQNTSELNPIALESLVSVEELSTKSVPELPPELVEIIEKIWEEEVLYA